MRGSLGDVAYTYAATIHCFHERETLRLWLWYSSVYTRVEGSRTDKGQSEAGISYEEEDRLAMVDAANVATHFEPRQLEIELSSNFDPSNIRTSIGWVNSKLVS